MSDRPTTPPEATDQPQPDTQSDRYRIEPKPVPPDSRSRVESDSRAGPDADTNDRGADQPRPDTQSDRYKIEPKPVPPDSRFRVESDSSTALDADSNDRGPGDADSPGSPETTLVGQRASDTPAHPTASDGAPTNGARDAESRTEPTDDVGDAASSLNTESRAEPVQVDAPEHTDANHMAATESDSLTGSGPADSSSTRHGSDDWPPPAGDASDADTRTRPHDTDRSLTEDSPADQGSVDQVIDSDVDQAGDAVAADTDPESRAPERVGAEQSEYPERGPGGVKLQRDEQGRVVPVDRSGHLLSDRDIAFIGADQPARGPAFDHAAIDRCARREVPLGMPPERWSEWQSSLRDALAADGVNPEEVDIRLKGSAAEFWSGPHKSMPTEESLASSLREGAINQETHDRAIQRLRDWEGSGEYGMPTARPFDAAYRLGLDDERSDYDMNLSSDSMFERGLNRWDEERYGNSPPDRAPKPPIQGHGYLNKDLVQTEFPNLDEWAGRWSDELERKMSYAVFPSRGPDDTTATGISVHYHSTDWVIQKPAEE